MTIQAPIDQKTMVGSSAEFYLSKKWSSPLLHLGAYKNPDIAPAGETVEDKYSNYTAKKVKDGDKFTVKFDVHEQRTDILGIIENGVVEFKQEVGTVTGRTEVYNPGQWNYDKDILLDKSNADGTQITPTTVTALISGVWTPLDAGDDYSIGVTMFGQTYISLLEGVLLDENSPTTVSIKVTYSATPDATITYAEHSQSGMPTGFVMVVEWKWKYGGQDMGIRMFLENCTNKKGALKPIDDDAGTTSGYSCEVTGTVKRHEFFGMD